MLVYLVKIKVKEGKIEEFKEATVRNHRDTIKEPGNYRFDVLQNQEDPTSFTLYEVYESEEAVQAHKETEHYLEWRERVADMMAQPREGIKHKVIAPQEKGQW